MVSVFFAEGFEEIEGLTVVDLLRRAGIGVETVSISESREVTGSHEITVQMDRLLAELDFDKTDMIVLPGGAGTFRLGECEPLTRQIRVFCEQGKYVGAICAAPGILGRLGLLKGRRACSYPAHEKYLEGAQVTRHCVEKDGAIITSRGMGTSVDFALAIVEQFQGSGAADALAQKIVYRTSSNAKDDCGTAVN